LPIEHIKLTSLFTPAQISCHADGMTCHELFRHLIELIGAGNHAVDVENTYRQILKRKSCGIAFVQPAAAVIHVRIKEVEELQLAIGIVHNGLHCAAALEGLACDIDDLTTAKLIVMVLAPLDDPTGYLRAISAIIRACKQDNFIARVFSQKDPGSVWNLFDETEVYLPEYLKARDIMAENYASLRDSDTLSYAIDTFCQLGVSELPVLDNDGDLIGIAGEDELIRICLPEYITWMEDLTPVLNFEPFAEVLRHEASVPLIEIMRFADSYATVDDDSPAIQVAKVMMRRDVRQVYVVREKKLLGIITIQDFIHKVLRA
jgi:CBS domain-containing protein/mannitol/fructose-specific phosphotransferase system IIA component (Ntr-type)